MKVHVAQYPQLRLLAWSFRDDLELDGQEALALYEDQWDLVEQEKLIPEERELIEKLVKEYGNGVFLHA